MNLAPWTGHGPGAYYINLRDTAEVPSWTLPTLTYHESIPGHHLQGAIANEAPLPMIRNCRSSRPILRAGRFMPNSLPMRWACTRTIPWDGSAICTTPSSAPCAWWWIQAFTPSGGSREKAIAYYVATIGDQDASATTEVERYCVWPGQACGYMLGKLAWLKQRGRAQAALGAGFDIRAFHDAGLTSGAVPLDVLPPDDRPLYRGPPCLMASTPGSPFRRRA